MFKYTTRILSAKSRMWKIYRIICYLQQMSGKEKEGGKTYRVKETQFYMWILSGILTQTNQLVRDRCLRKIKETKHCKTY